MNSTQKCRPTYVQVYVYSQGTNNIEEYKVYPVKSWNIKGREVKAERKAKIEKQKKMGPGKD